MNQLVPQEAFGGELARQEDLSVLLTGGEYLPYFRLYGSNTDAVKEDKIGVAHYGMERDGKITDAGKEVEVVILAGRHKAVQTGDNMIVDYHPDIVDSKVTNSTYAHIMKMSGVKDSGAMFGPELLLWIPSLTSFVTWHLNNKTARREAKHVNIDSFYGKAATLKSKLIDPETSKYKWHGPVITELSAKLEIPPVEEIQEQVEKFLNPPRNQVEITTASGSDERAR